MDTKLSLYEKCYEVTEFGGYGKSQMVAIKAILDKYFFSGRILGDFVPGC